MRYDNRQFGNHTSWYRDINPNEHTYTTGYGFAPKPPAMVERQLIGSYGCAVGLCVMGFFLLGSLIPSVLLRIAAVIFPAPRSVALEELLMGIAGAAGSIGALALPLICYALWVKIPAASALPARRVPAGLTLLAVLVGLGVSVIGAFFTGVVSLLLEQMGLVFLSPDYVMPQTPAAQLLYVANIALIPAVVEEFAFRGVLMQSLRRFGDGFALVVSALFFAMSHLLPVRFPFAFVMGLVIGYFVLFTGSVWTGVAIHFANNAFTLVAMSLEQTEVFPVWLMASRLAMLTAGIVAAVMLMRRYEEAFSLRLSATLNSEGQKIHCFFTNVPMLMLLVLVLVLAAGYLAVP